MKVAPQAEKAKGPSRDTHVRRAILVLGMHRSGTSAITRCLNLLGVNLGDNLLPAAEDNPKGFWEHTEIVRIHEELLTTLGRKWSDARALPDGWLTTQAARKARDELSRLVRDDFGSSALWAAKDPRLCRLVPLWREILLEQGIETAALLVVRHPLEVARSLQVRDGMSLDTSYLSWLEYFAEAEIDTRAVPRSLVLYEDLLSDWRLVISRIGRDLGVEWPRSFDKAQSDVDTYLDRGERHHHANENDISIPKLLQRLYELCRLRNAGSGSWDEISRLVDGYRLIASTFLDRESQLAEELQASESRTHRAEHAIKAVLDGFDRSASEARAIRMSRSTIDDHAMLYFRSNLEQFAEDRAQSHPHVWGNSAVTFHFELPAGKRVAEFRFDPSQRAGAFHVEELRIDGVPVRDLPVCVRRVNQISLGQPVAGGVWFMSFDDDPYIEFDLQSQALQSDRSISIEVDCRRFDIERMTSPFMLSMMDQLRRQLESNDRDLAADLSRQNATIELVQTNNGRLEAELKNIRDHNAQQSATIKLLQANNEQLEMELDGIRQHNAQLQKQLEEQLTIVARLDADLAVARERERESWQEASRLAGQVAAVRYGGEKAKALQIENTALRCEYEQSQAAVIALADELSAIKSSTLWRLFVRLRSMLLLMPPNIRSILRRALKAQWWLVTPWRMPRRLHFLAQRRVATRKQQDPIQLDLATPIIVPVMPPQREYRYASPTANAAKISETLLGLSRRILFSIVVPVYNTDPELLRCTIASVEAQWYPHWELILVDDHSSAPHVQQVFGKFADPRIVTVSLEQNKGISGATNEGIMRARGDFIVFLDHDDELTVDCLYELALCIDRENPDYLYSDEDKLDVNGSFRDPFFKPDWSPDTMMSTMYTCHVSCVRRRLALEVGGLRSEYDGSQDWDFVLRATERASRISHIPKVLYHWRIIPASCASDLQAKPYAIDASKRAREDALRRRGLSGDLVPVPELPGYFRTRYHLRGEPLFSIIIPSKNNGAVLKACIDSIFEKTAYRRFEVVVIDNGSTDFSTRCYLEKLRKREGVIVLDHAVPFNYSEINNFGVRHANGEIFVFLNDDTEILSENWLDYMGGYAQLPHVGAVGAKLLYPAQRTVQHGGVINLPCGPSHAFLHMEASHPGYFNRNLLEYNWLAVTGACMMLDRKKFEAVGGFDENLAVAYNDIDLCFSLYEAGLLQVVCPSVTLIHHESLTRGDDTANAEKMARLERERTVLFRKHPDLVGRDPFHNLNLDPDDVYFGIRAGSHSFESCTSTDYPILASQTNTQCGLDIVDGQRATDVIQASRRSPLTLIGWMGDGRGNAAGDFVAVLENGLHTYHALARTCVPRPDVAKALHCGGMANSGFRITVSLRDVEPGTYRLQAVKPGDPDAGCTLASRFIVQ